MTAGLAPPPGISAAILRTVAYADIFDFPVTVEEIVRYLERPSSVSLVNQELEATQLIPRQLSRRQGYTMLAGRESIVPIRERRMELATRLWPQAVRFGRLIARLPFVRMIAVTGSLAMNNPTGEADIDYLVVTDTGRLWTCRAFVIGIVRWAALRGTRLCPNYFLDMDSLELQDQTLYTAREVAQMVPLYGLEVYRQLRAANAWVDRLLPNAGGTPASLDLVTQNSRLKQTMERLLSGAAGRSLETWEMGRKITKLGRLMGDDSEAHFTAGQCKGHNEAHRKRTMDQYRRSSKVHNLGSSFS